MSSNRNSAGGGWVVHTGPTTAAQARDDARAARDQARDARDETRELRDETKELRDEAVAASEVPWYKRW